MSMQSLKKNETARTAYKFKKNVCIYEKMQKITKNIKNTKNIKKNHKKHKKTQKTLKKITKNIKKHTFLHFLNNLR